MIGFVALIGAYVTTGQIIPGVTAALGAYAVLTGQTPEAEKFNGWIFGF